MIETGPAEAAAAALAALTEAVKRAEVLPKTGQPEIDRAVQVAQLQQIEMLAFAHLVAVRELLEAAQG